MYQAGRGSTKYWFAGLSPQDRALLAGHMMHAGPVGVHLPTLLARLKVEKPLQLVPGPDDGERPELPHADDRTRMGNSRHEAHHAIVALAFGWPVNLVEVDECGRSGRCGLAESLDDLGATPMQRLTWAIAGATSDFDLFDDPFNDDPLGKKFGSSDRAKVDAILDEMYHGCVENGYRLSSEMSFKHTMIHEACADVRKIVDANWRTVNDLADEIYQRSFDGRFLGADDFSPVVPASACGID